MWNKVRDDWHVADFHARMERLRAHVQSIDHMKAMSPAVRAHLGLPSSAQMERDVWRDVVGPEFLRGARRDVEWMWLFDKHNTDSVWFDFHVFLRDLSVFRWFAKTILGHIGQDEGYGVQVRDLQTTLRSTEGFGPFYDPMVRAMDEYATLWVESHGDEFVKDSNGNGIYYLDALMTKEEITELHHIDSDLYGVDEGNDDEESDEESDD